MRGRKSAPVEGDHEPFGFLTTEAKPLVAYFRVSTREQGRSGLGLEAQRAAVARFADSEGFEIVAEHVEIETGKGSDALERRPNLAEALAEARRNGKACPFRSSIGSRVTCTSFLGSWRIACPSSSPS